MIRRVGGTVVLVLLLTASLGAGGVADGEPGALCAARDELRAALDELQDVDVIREGTNALRGALERLRRALTATVEAARALAAFGEAAQGQGEQVRADATRLRAAIDAVLVAVRASEGQPLVERARTVGDALAQVVNLTGQLLQSVAPVCP